ncbi:MAG: N-glycosylase/DNA lyase [Candidatus Woesearchaeota archaeon]
MICKICYTMLTHTELKKQYRNKQFEVKKRLDDFAKNGKSMRDKDMFLELCFCICTPQSKAVKVAEVITKENIDKLLKLNHAELAELLRRNTRFHNNKAKHIIHARRYINKLKDLDKDSLKAREYLVKNIKGLGYKEASHYLRNIGYRNLCIVDRHVINLMHELKVFPAAINPSTPKKYLEMESKIKKYADTHGYDVDELDLVLWSIKTGYVFR